MPRPGRHWPDTRHSELPRPAHWDRSAACRETDPDVFFPEGEEDEVLEKTAAARAVCNSCPVAHPCLVDALDRDERYGVWGGLDVPDRDRLKLRRSEPGAADDEEAASDRAPAAA